MNNVIKAIETEYDGHRFRSRIEARWAVFFNAIGLKYEYEIEGFQMGELRYLPDFYIPSLDLLLTTFMERLALIRGQKTGSVGRITMPSFLPPLG